MNYNEQQYERHLELYNRYGGEANKHNLIHKPNKPYSDEELAQRAIDEREKAQEIVHRFKEREAFRERTRAQTEERIASGELVPHTFTQPAKAPISKSWLGRNRRKKELGLER